jgi:hypothetical protein
MDMEAVLGFLGIFVIGYALGIKKGCEKKSDSGTVYIILLGAVLCFLFFSQFRCNFPEGVSSIKSI